MAIQDDKETLLDALFKRHLQTGRRPSVVEAQMHYLPEWDRDRTFDAAQALEIAGDILNATSAALYVDLSSTARQRATARATPAPAAPVTFNIGSAHNSPMQAIASGGHGVQNTHYQMTANDLRAVVDLYREHVEELNLDEKTRRRADAQIATIEAQLLDEPDEGIVRAAGKSLKSIVQGALTSAAGAALTNPNTWTPLLSLFS